MRPISSVTSTATAAPTPPTRRPWTLVALVNATSSIAENTSVSGGLKVADIVIVDLDPSKGRRRGDRDDAASFTVKEGVLGKELCTSAETSTSRAARSPTTSR